MWPTTRSSPASSWSARIRHAVQGFLIDLHALFPDFGFEGLEFYAPDLQFVAPGSTLSAGTNTTAPVSIPIELFGIDNHLDPGDTLTESYNPVVSDIIVRDLNSATSFEVTNQTFLFDTGAQLSVISEDIALALGLDLENPETSIDVQGAAGQTTLLGYTIDQLVLPRDDNNDGIMDGELVFTNVPVYVLDLFPGLTGILGMNLFNTASQILYDPFDPDGAGGGGASLSVTFSTVPRDVLTGEEEQALTEASAANPLFGAFAGAITGSGQFLPGFEVDAVNDTPSVSLANTVSSLPEDTNTTNHIKVADIVISDDALGTNVLSLSGTDAAFFEIDGGQLFLKAGTTLNFESKPSYQVTVNVDDASLGSGPEDSESFTLTLTDVNEAPSVSLTNTVSSLPENSGTTSPTLLADIDISDDALGANVLSLSGTDADFFEIAGGQLFLKTGTTLNFENKPSYQVTINVDDTTSGSGVEDSEDFTLTLTDVNEAPSVSLTNTVSSLPVDTNTTSHVRVADIGISDDALGTNALSLSGTDAAFFEIDAGQLFLKAGTTLDFENKPSYQVTVNVDDASLGSGPEDSETFTLTITDVNEAPSLSLTNTVTALPENSSTASHVRMADIGISDDALGTNVLSLSGTDAAFFEIDGGQLFLKAGTTLDFENKPSYQITVNVDDASLGSGPEDSESFTLTLTDVNEAPSLSLTNTVTSLPENSSTISHVRVADIGISDDALGTNVLSLSGTDAAFFEIDGGQLFLKAGTTLNFENKPSYQVTVNVDDASLGSGPEDSESFTLTLTDVNEAPSLSLTNTVTSLPENSSTISHVRVADIDISDDALGTNVLSLSGTDAAFFEIDAGQLFVKAGTTLNFENKPSYQVTVNVDDASLGSGPEDSETFTLTLADVNEAPSLSLTNTVTSLPENSSTTNHVRVADIDISNDALGTNVLSLAGTDAAFFEIDGGQLFLKAGTSLNFETKPSYQVTVNVDDASLGSGPEDSESFTLTLTDVNEAPSLSLTNTVTSLPESSSTISRTRVANIVISDDALGTNVLSLSGTDAAFFEIAAGQLFLKAGTTLNFDIQTSYQVTVNVDDASLGTGLEDSDSFTLTITNVNGTVVDNTDPGFSLTGSGWSAPGGTNAYNGSYVYSPPGNGATTAPPGLSRSRRACIVSLPPGRTLASIWATNAPFTILDGSPFVARH